MQETATTISLPPDLRIGTIAEARSLLDECIANDSDIVIDGSTLQSIDTAGLQLLAVFARAAKARNLTITWRELPASIAQIAADLGWPGALDG